MRYLQCIITVSPLYPKYIGAVFVGFYYYSLITFGTALICPIFIVVQETKNKKQIYTKPSPLDWLVRGSLRVAKITVLDFSQKEKSIIR